MASKSSENKAKAKNPAPAHAWKPGQSGNPGGRPKIPAEVVELARLHTKEAILVFVDVMQNGTDEKARTDAAERLLNRAWGKPTERVELTGEDGGPVEASLVMQALQPNIADIKARARKAAGK